MQGWLASRASTASHSRVSALDRAFVEAVGARHLLPDEQPEAVRPVEVARVLDLLVLAHAVEPHRLAPARRRGGARRRPARSARSPASSPGRGRGGRRCGRPFRRNAIALNGDRAHRRVALDRVDQLAASGPAASSSASISVGRAGTPEQLVARVVDARIGEGDPPAAPRPRPPVAVVRDRAPPARKLTVEPEIVARLAGDAARRARSPSVRGSPASGARRSRRRRDRFEPDRLPDPGRPRVPDAVRLEQPVLLAARFREIARIVLGTDDDLCRRQSPGGRR